MIIAPFGIGITFIFLSGWSHAKEKYLHSAIHGLIGIYFIVSAIGAR